MPGRPGGPARDLDGQEVSNDARASGKGILMIRSERSWEPGGVTAGRLRLGHI